MENPRWWTTCFSLETAPNTAMKKHFLSMVLYFAFVCISTSSSLETDSVNEDVNSDLYAKCKFVGYFIKIHAALIQFQLKTKISRLGEYPHCITKLGLAPHF